MTLVKKIKRKINKVLRVKTLYKSETSKIRHLVAQFCKGNGCDIGFGGDKIVKDNCVGIDFKKPYAYTGKDKVDIACDLMNGPVPVPDNTYDYIYTSHLIEDFVDTKKALEEFIRILKSGGNLLLVFPDQPTYEIYCLKTGQPVNTYHIHKKMGLRFMYDILYTINNISYKILFESDCEVDYNVIMVLKIVKK